MDEAEIHAIWQQARAATAGSRVVPDLRDDDGLGGRRADDETRRAR